MRTYDRECGVCGKKFVTDRPAQKYCGDHCARVRQLEQLESYRLKARQAPAVKVCAIKGCGKSFTPKSARSAYCSTGCKLEGLRIVRARQEERRRSLRKGVS